MQRYCLILLMLALISLLGCRPFPPKQNAEPLPDPPVGFSWMTSKNGVGSFLIPSGWHAKEESQRGTNVLYISKDKIKKNNPLEVGLTVKQINGWSKQQGTKPSQYAQSYAASLAASGHVLKQGVMQGNASDMHVVRLKTINKGVSTIVHHIVIGLDPVDKVYLLSFESPENQWEKESQQGREMLNNFLLGE